MCNWDQLEPPVVSMAVDSFTLLEGHTVSGCVSRRAQDHVRALDAQTSCLENAAPVPAVEDRSIQPRNNFCHHPASQAEVSAHHGPWGP